MKLPVRRNSHMRTSRNVKADQAQCRSRRLQVEAQDLNVHPRYIASLCQALSRSLAPGKAPVNAYTVVRDRLLSITTGFIC